MSSRRAPRRAAGLEGLLAAREMVVVCGAGGVGKTTTAAALAAMAATELGGRVLVLTVDPARRLATAMGVDSLGGRPVRVEIGASGSGRQRGELLAAMLDTKASWDELVRRHAPDDATCDAILANPLYRNITGRFVHSHDYIAMEKLHELHTSGDYDLVVIDTPPSTNALDLLDAPQRMIEFFGGRLLRWLTVPTRSRLFSAASRPFYQVADRVLGSRFLQDIAEFFLLFQSMEAGFVRRAREVEALLHDPRTTFVAVTTLEAAPLVETEALIRELGARDLHLGGVVANRVLPDELRGRRPAAAAGRMRERAEVIGGRLAEVVGADRPTVTNVVREVVDRFDDIAVVAVRQHERLAELARSAGTMAVVPMMDGDVHDLDGLRRIGSALWGRS